MSKETVIELSPEDFEKVVKAINEPSKENKKLREKLKRKPLWVWPVDWKSEEEVRAMYERESKE